MPFPNNHRRIPFLSEKIHILVAITIPGAWYDWKPARIRGVTPAKLHLSRWKRGNEPRSTAILRPRDLSSKTHRSLVIVSKPWRTNAPASNSSPEETLSLLDRETRVDETRRSIHPISFTVETRAREGDAWPLAKSVSGYIGSAASFAATHKFGRW